jgi:hypothetical protein
MTDDLLKNTLANIGTMAERSNPTRVVQIDS